MLDQYSLIHVRGLKSRDVADGLFILDTSNVFIHVGMLFKFTLTTSYQPFLFSILIGESVSSVPTF